MSKDNRTRIQDEIVDSLPSPAHGLLQLAPRVGKSRIAIRMMKNEQPESILWVTPNEQLRDVDIPNQFAEWSAKRYLKKATIICYGSLKNVTGHFDKIILDEYQYITDGNSWGLLSGQLTYNSIVGLSGTHPEHWEKNEIYRRLGLKALVKIGIDDAVDEDLLADYQINVMDVDMNHTDKNITAGTKDKPFMTTEAAHYEYLSNVAQEAIMQRRKDITFRIMNRRRFIANSPSKHETAEWLIDNLPGRKLIFAGSIKQAEELSPHTYHSKTDNKDLQAFVKEEIDILACVNAGGIGNTYRNVDHFIIVQSDSDKRGDTSQKLARSLLKQGDDYKANIWFLRLIGTQDVKWVDKALESFDKTKIVYERFLNLKNGSKTLENQLP